MSNLHPFVVEMHAMLRNLDRWLGKAAEHAKNKNFDPEVFVNARLAPDQYPLVKQVQSACDAAKFAAARLAGKDPPVHPDEEKTFEELRARIAKVGAYLETFTEKDLEGADARKVPIPYLPGGNKGALGIDYLVGLALPNFFFHVTTAYAILRHNGVDLGKRDYIGEAVKIIEV